jgi:hypothetical protein
MQHYNGRSRRRRTRHRRLFIAKVADPVLVVVQQLSELWRISSGELVRQTSENFLSLPHLAESEKIAL